MSKNNIEKSYKKLLAEIQSLKKEMGIEKISDSEIVFGTIVQKHPLSPFAVNIKMLVKLIEKKEEYENFVKHTAYDTFGVII